MDKIIINGTEYEVIGNINMGKREYVFVVANNRLEIFKKVVEQYIAPNKDLTLEGNAGGSLTELNENVSLSHLRDMLQKDFFDKVND